MKQFYKIVSLSLFACMMLVLKSPTVVAQDQDTLLVEWYDAEKPGPFSNNLYNVIQADTNDQGERYPNRVYQLRKGGFYYLSETIQNDGWHLNIVGNGPKDVPEDGDNPPMLQIGTREDATSPTKMFRIRGDWTIKDVIVNGKTTLGSLPYEVIDVRYDDGRFVIDNVIFEYAQWGIMGIYSKNADIFYTNNISRNLVSENEPWGGRGLSIWSDVDTVWVENNSFHNIGFTTLQIEGGSANYVWFNQNTIVNNGRQVVLWRWVKEAYFTNNVVLNGFWQGEDKSQMDEERLNGTDQQYSGMFDIMTIPSEYGLDAQRRIAIANNAFYIEQEYLDYYTADNDTFDIRKQPLLNTRMTNLFDANENMVVKDNYFDTEDPGFATYADNHQDRIDFITDIRQANSPIHLYYWDPNRLDDNTSVQWPLPEDLSYTNSTLNSAALGGHPLGDLNWNPSAKATWEANKSTQESLVKGLLGGVIEVTYAGTIEGEKATFTGGTVIEAAPARQQVRVEAAGTIEWADVNIATAGDYDVQVSKRTWYSDTNPNRATSLSINDGSSIVITLGEDQDGTTWSTPIASGVTFLEGSNKVALKKNWGYMEYQWVKILEAGTENVVATLWPGEAELIDGGSYQCPAGGICASKDNLADTKDGGSLTMNFDSDGTGSYTLKLNYMLTDGDKDVTVSLNGSEVINQTLTATGDSVYTELNLNGFDFSSGSNEIVINAASGGIQVDKVDFFVIGELTPVSNEDEIDLVNSFSLSQNYPNPFNPTTNINFNLPVSANVSLKVYNLLGQEVQSLLNEARTAGSYTVKFDARNLASGVYFYRLEAGSFVTQRKMTLIK